MSELSDQLINSYLQRILEESLPKPSEPIRLESEEVFDSELKGPVLDFQAEADDFFFE